MSAIRLGYLGQALPCQPLVSVVLALVHTPCVLHFAVQFKLSVCRHLVATRTEKIRRGMTISVGRWAKSHGLLFIERKTTQTFHMQLKEFTLSQDGITSNFR